MYYVNSSRIFIKNNFIIPKNVYQYFFYLSPIGFPKAISITFFITIKNSNCTLPLSKFLIVSKDDDQVA